MERKNRHLKERILAVIMVLILLGGTRVFSLASESAVKPTATDTRPVVNINLTTVSGTGNGYSVSGKKITFNTAAANYQYVITQTNYNTPIDKYMAIADNAKVTMTLNGVNISTEDAASPLAIGENAELMLYIQKTNKLVHARITSNRANSRAGLEVGSGSNLVIDGTGSLTAQGAYYSAGIGKSYNIADGGNITINGGTITAIRGNFGACIGAGLESSIGDITINGGTIDATEIAYGTSGGAGIGGGNAGAYDNIIINGGDITATGISGGAGIGADTTSSRGGELGSITINGGTIVASGRLVAIGGVNAYACDIGDIIITGGNIEATGIVGIGGDFKAGAKGLVIERGEVTATSTATAFSVTSGYVAGAGLAAAGGAGIYIEEGTVTATGARGICSVDGEVSIGTKADVTAYARWQREDVENYAIYPPVTDNFDENNAHVINAYFNESLSKTTETVIHVYEKSDKDTVVKELTLPLAWGGACLCLYNREQSSYG